MYIAVLLKLWISYNDIYNMPMDTIEEMLDLSEYVNDPDKMKALQWEKQVVMTDSMKKLMWIK